MAILVWQTPGGSEEEPGPEGRKFFHRPRINDFVSGPKEMGFQTQLSFLAKTGGAGELSQKRRPSKGETRGPIRAAGLFQVIPWIRSLLGFLICWMGPGSGLES